MLSTELRIQEKFVVGGNDFIPSMRCFANSSASELLYVTSRIGAGWSVLLHAIEMSLRLSRALATSGNASSITVSGGAAGVPISGGIVGLVRVSRRETKASV